MEELIKMVSDKTGVSVKEMRSPFGPHNTCEARKIFMYLSKALYGRTDSEIATFIGRSRQHVSCQLIDFDQQLRIYKGLAKKVKEIEHAVLQCQ